MCARMSYKRTECTPINSRSGGRTPAHANTSHTSSSCAAAGTVCARRHAPWAIFKRSTYRADGRHRRCGAREGQWQQSSEAWRSMRGLQAPMSACLHKCVKRSRDRNPGFENFTHTHRHVMMAGTVGGFAGCIMIFHVSAPCHSRSPGARARDDIHHPRPRLLAHSGAARLLLRRPTPRIATNSGTVPPVRVHAAAAAAADAAAPRATATPAAISTSPRRAARSTLVTSLATGSARTTVAVAVRKTEDGAARSRPSNHHLRTERHRPAAPRRRVGTRRPTASTRTLERQHPFRRRFKLRPPHSSRPPVRQTATLATRCGAECHRRRTQSRPCSQQSRSEVPRRMRSSHHVGRRRSQERDASWNATDRCDRDLVLDIHVAQVVQCARSGLLQAD
jgi:hypothetical protein